MISIPRKRDLPMICCTGHSFLEKGLFCSGVLTHGFVCRICRGFPAMGVKDFDTLVGRGGKYNHLALLTRLMNIFLLLYTCLTK